jgi:pimeloyl-ACP methyl ester carboxylesterase
MREWGDADKPLLVLLHGGALSSAEWTDLGPRFAETHHVVAPDARAFGAAEILGEVEELGLRDFALVGHSFGAVVGCLYAARHPDHMTKLVMVDAGPVDRAQPVALQNPPLAFADRDEAAAWLARSIPRGYPDWYLDSRFVTQPDGTLTWPHDMAARVEWSRAGGEPLIPGLWPYVEALQVPTLVVRGAESPLFPLENAHRMAELNPRVRVLDVPEAGHFVHIDQPDVFFDAVQEFLAE